MELVGDAPYPLAHPQGEISLAEHLVPEPARRDASALSAGEVFIERVQELYFRMWCACAVLCLDVERMAAGGEGE